MSNWRNPHFLDNLTLPQYHGLIVLTFPVHFVAHVHEDSGREQCSDKN